MIILSTLIDDILMLLVKTLVKKKGGEQPLKCAGFNIYTNLALG
jgi:hypothetical protein